MWRYLLGRALQSLPGHLLAADPDMERRLRRFAGRTVCVQPSSAQYYIRVQFQPSGAPLVDWSGRPFEGSSEECDLLLSRRNGRFRFQGDRRLALRLLATLRQYRPDFEEVLEIWLGTLPAGIAAGIRQRMTAVDLRQKAEAACVSLRDAGLAAESFVAAKRNKGTLQPEPA